MKSLYFIIVLITGACFTAAAQTQPAEKKYDHTASLPFLKTDTTAPNYSIKKAYTTDLLNRATYSHSTQQGKVYIMPYDRSACLVPDATQVSPMPTVKPKALPRMPNAYDNNKVIPSKPKE